jgi:hypothetical protein
MLDHGQREPISLSVVKLGGSINFLEETESQFLLFRLFCSGMFGFSVSSRPHLPQPQPRIDLISGAVEFSKRKRRIIRFFPKSLK